MDPRVGRVFTDREGGASAPPFAAFNLGTHVGDDPAAVAANRAALASAHGLDRIVWMDQVHSATVAVVDATAASGPVPATDGLVTTAVGLGLAVLVADCVPVVAADPVAGVVGVAHAGRNGAAAGIAVRLVETMASVGASAADLEVLIGPSVCGRCYEVPPDMQAAVADLLPGSACDTRWGTTGLDLAAGLHRQLAGLGATVAVDGRCTVETPTLFSHRRGAPTGRQAGLVWLRS
ncbi:peptidoglycan editing factor PgeF [Nakamurella deserti]|uniref:peptidoglycan editing factor PgeF n=1 Tax=Nakamurella deserti TaxID=2164074 RepID=UPI000DBE9B7F|nr:peptidoglycan editing factor PgeF [Nakamurella deserti]